MKKATLYYTSLTLLINSVTEASLVGMHNDHRDIKEICSDLAESRVCPQSQFDFYNLLSSTNDAATKVSMQAAFFYYFLLKFDLYQELIDPSNAAVAQIRRREGGQACYDNFSYLSDWAKNNEHFIGTISHITDWKKNNIHFIGTKNLYSQLLEMRGCIELDGDIARLQIQKCSAEVLNGLQGLTNLFFSDKLIGLEAKFCFLLSQLHSFYDANEALWVASSTQLQSVQEIRGSLFFYAFFLMHSLHNRMESSPSATRMNDDSSTCSRLINKTMHWVKSEADLIGNAGFCKHLDTVARSVNPQIDLPYKEFTIINLDLRSGKRLDSKVRVALQNLTEMYNSDRARKSESDEKDQTVSNLLSLGFYLTMGSYVILMFKQIFFKGQRQESMSDEVAHNPHTHLKKPIPRHNSGSENQGHLGPRPASFSPDLFRGSYSGAFTPLLRGPSAELAVPASEGLATLVTAEPAASAVLGAQAVAVSATPFDAATWIAQNVECNFNKHVEHSPRSLLKRLNATGITNREDQLAVFNAVYGKGEGPSKIENAESTIIMRSKR